MAGSGVRSEEHATGQDAHDETAADAGPDGDEQHRLVAGSGAVHRLAEGVHVDVVAHRDRQPRRGREAPAQVGAGPAREGVGRAGDDPADGVDHAGAADPERDDATALVLLAAATIGASLLLVGHQPMTGLSGQVIDPSTALSLVTASWATMAPPLIAFTCLALLFSVWSRNAAVGIAGPVVLGMVMQLIGGLGGIEAIRPLLLTTPFEAWHGLLAAPRFTGPLLEGVVTSAVWSVASLAAAFLILRNRDINGG